MKPLLLTLTGLGVGLTATALCALLGLQSRYWQTLITINVLTGLGGAIGGNAALTTYRRATRQREIKPAELDQAIGVISERYALNPDKQQVLIALQELKGAIDDR
jgi:hypothetical protein